MVCMHDRKRLHCFNNAKSIKGSYLIMSIENFPKFRTLDIFRMINLKSVDTYVCTIYDAEDRFTLILIDNYVVIRNG